MFIRIIQLAQTTIYYHPKNFTKISLQEKLIIINTVPKKVSQMSSAPMKAF